MATEQRANAELDEQQRKMLEKAEEAHAAEEAEAAPQPEPVQSVEDEPEQEDEQEILEVQLVETDEEAPAGAEEKPEADATEADADE